MPASNDANWSPSTSQCALRGYLCGRVPSLGQCSFGDRVDARPACCPREIGLEQLRLAARGGTGLERFYSGLDWEVTGRWPGALRFAPGDDRDEILMILAPL